MVFSVCFDQFLLLFNTVVLLLLVFSLTYHILLLEALCYVCLLLFYNFSPACKENFEVLEIVEAHKPSNSRGYGEFTLKEKGDSYQISHKNNEPYTLWNAELEYLSIGI